MAVNYRRLLHAAAYWPMWPHPVYKDEWDWGHRLMTWGPPGGGKTSSSRDFAARNGMRFIVIDSSIGEAALGAIPVPDMEAGVLRFMSPDFVAEPCSNGKPVYLLCDDATTFAPTLQAMLLGLFLDGRLGSYWLPGRARVMMAANEPIDAPGGWDLAPSVANRPCHIDWPDPTVDEWCTWVVTGGRKRVGQTVDPDAEEARVLAVRAECMMRASADMVGFSLAKRELHRVQPDANDPQASKAWVSPRTKYFALMALAAAFAHDLDAETTDIFVAGYVGETFAAQWATWRADRDLPDARAFLEGRERFEHNPYRVDRTAALIGSCLSLLGSTEGSREQGPLASAFYQFLETISEDALDKVADVVIDSMYAMGLVRGIKNANVVLKKLRPVLEATEVA